MKFIELVLSVVIVAFAATKGRAAFVSPLEKQETEIQAIKTEAQIDKTPWQQGGLCWYSPNPHLTCIENLQEKTLKAINALIEKIQASSVKDESEVMEILADLQAAKAAIEKERVSTRKDLKDIHAQQKASDPAAHIRDEKVFALEPTLKKAADVVEKAKTDMLRMLKAKRTRSKTSIPSTPVTTRTMDLGGSVATEEAISKSAEDEAKLQKEKEATDKLKKELKDAGKDHLKSSTYQNT